MKPRFSILTLLGITAYVAVIVAGLVNPTWALIATCLWYAVMFAAVIVATGRVSGSVVFARGIVFGGMFAYMVSIFNYYLIITPISSFIEDSETSVPEEMLYWVLQLTLQNVLLLFGVMTGSLALWRYRRLERREQREKASR